MIRLALSLLMVGGLAQSARGESNKSLNWAERMFSALEHDFGVVTRGADVHHRIAIHNTYGEPITLHAVKSTCGCTTPELSTRRLQPGETGYLELKLNTVRFSRHKHPNVDVQLSFANSPITTVRIPVHAYIREDVATSQDIVDFGVVGTGESPSRTVSITYSGRSPWKITGVQDAGSGVTVEVSKAARSSQGLVYKLTIALSPDLPVGQMERSLVILTEEPARSYLSLRVRANVEPDIVLANPIVQVGLLQPNATATARVVVRGRRPFGIEAVEAVPGTASATFAPAEKSVHVVPVTITAPAAPGKFSRELVVKIAGHTPVICRIEGEVVAGVAGGLVEANR